MSREFASIHDLDQDSEGIETEWEVSPNKKRLLAGADMAAVEAAATKTAKKVRTGVKSRTLSQELDRPEMTESNFLRGLGLATAEEAETNARVQWLVKNGLTSALSSFPLHRESEEQLDRSFYENLFTTDKWIAKQGQQSRNYYRYTTLVQLAESNALGFRTQ